MACVAEMPIDEDQIEHDEILCQWNAREAARPVVHDLAQLSREYVAKVALAEVLRDPDLLDKSTSVKLNRSEKCAKAQCRQGSAVVDSSLVCEQCCANENRCSFSKCLKLSTNRGSNDRNNLA